MSIVVALLGQAESHIQASVDSSVVSAFVDHRERVGEVVGVALIVDSELLDVVTAVVEDLG